MCHETPDYLDMPAVNPLMIWLWIGGVSWVLLMLAFWVLFRSVPELPPCRVGCYLDLSTGAISHVLGCPNQEQEG